MDKLIFDFKYIKINKKKNDRSCLVSKYNDCDSGYRSFVGFILHIHL